MRHHLALVACIALTGSAALAAPAGRHGKTTKKAKHRAKVAPPVREPIESDEDRSDDDDDEVETPAAARFSGKRKPARTARALDLAGTEDDDAIDEDATEVIRAPVRLRKKARARKAKDWHVAIGPYVWASSVDAEVSLGSASVESGVDFMDLTRHTRWGAELLAEVRYRRFSISSDLMYGVIDINGDKTVGPLMVSLKGTASSLLVDGNLGYTLTGNDHSWISLEARAGVRYQRTKIVGAVGIGGSEVASTEQISAAADAVAGARVVVRPFERLYASGSFDLGVFGDSSLTWSASADANVRITSRVLLSLGYRTLTMIGANVSMKMHGPRAALQLLF